VKLAVLGATGSVRELVTQALEAGHEVTVLVREAVVDCLGRSS
jgi:putative NADH-flavin reductase